MVKFPHSHQDPRSAVLDVLQPLDVFAGDPNEKCVTVVQPGGDKGVDKLFSIVKSESGMEFGNVPQVEKGGLAEVFYVVIEGELWVHFDAKIGH